LLGAPPCPDAATTFPAWVPGAPILQLLDSGFSVGLCMPGASIAGRSVLAVTFRVWPNRKEESVSEPAGHGMI